MNDTHSEFTPKVYESGGSLVVTIPQNVAEIDGITPGDILNVKIKQITKAKPDKDQ